MIYLLINIFNLKYTQFHIFIYFKKHQQKLNHFQNILFIFILSNNYYFIIILIFIIITNDIYFCIKTLILHQNPINCLYHFRNLS